MKSNKDDLELKKSLSKYWPAGKNFHSSSISFIKRYQNKIIVIKYGGYALTKINLMKSFSKNIALLNKVGIKTVNVHGGGPQIEAELKKRKIKDSEYQGLRVTTESILKIVKNILSKKLNKIISLELNKFGRIAKRVDGMSLKVIEAKIALNGNIGYVGEPTKLDKKTINKIITNKKVPIIAPIGYTRNGTCLNINADTAAAFIAETLKAERLLLLTDVEGVLNNNKKLIPELDRKKAFEYIKKGTIKSGMIPKIRACFNTLRNGAKGVALIDGRKQNAVLMELLTKQGAGTLIKK